MKPNKPFQLVITHSAWEQAARALLFDQHRVAVGPVRWNDEPSVSELLVHRLEIVEPVPSGEQQPPLTDWLVLAIDPGSPLDSPHKWLERIGPRQSQVVVIAVLSAADRTRWDGLVFDQGRVVPLEGIRIIGPRMLRLSRTLIADDIDPHDRQRWSRTIGALGEDVWRKVHDAHVVLIGTGRNGSQMAWQLASLGVGRLSLVDPDVLGLENLDAMPGMTVIDVGRSKVTALADRLLAFRPELSLRCFDSCVTEVLDRLRTRAQLIVTCVDDDTPRLAASWLSRETLTPHLDVGTSVQRDGDDSPDITGDVRLLLPFEGCCSCVGSLADADASLYELAAPPGSLHRGAPVHWTDQRAGSLVTNTVAVSTGVQVWLALLSGDVSGSLWHRLQWQQDASLEVQSAVVGSSDDCRFCSQF